MDSEPFQYHESGETIDKGRHGKLFETDFGKFILFRLICQREKFKNFKFTREKKGTGKFDDFLFAYDSDNNKTKYSLIQLKHLTDKTRKLNFDDLTDNSKSSFGLPYYFDYYAKSLSCLSSDKDLKEAELENLIFCTNIGFEDSLGCISKIYIQNDGLFQKSGTLYKLSINDEGKKEIFHEQFLSDRKRLANELATYVMQNKEIYLDSLINNDSFSFIQRFSEMLLEQAVDVEKNIFKESFLDPDLKNQDQELDNFRNEFFNSLFSCQKKSKKFIDSFPTDKNNIEEFLTFLRNITIKIVTKSEYKNIKILSQELVLSVMLQIPFDIKSNIHDQKSLQKLSKLIEEHVIDLNSKKLKESFLNDKSGWNKELCKFRLHFFEALKKFCEDLKDKNEEEIKKFLKFFNSESSVQAFKSSLNLILENKKNVVVEFLKKREIRFTELPVGVPTSIEMFPSGEVDTKEVDKNIITFLNKLIFVMNQNDFENIISNEMKQHMTKNEDQILLFKGFNNFMDNWHNEGFISFVLFDLKIKCRKWITEDRLLNDIKNSKISFQNRVVKFSEICSSSEIITPDLFMHNFTTNAIMNLGKCVDKDSDSFYIQRTLAQCKRVDINSLIEQSQYYVIVTIPRGFNPTYFDKLRSHVKLEDLKMFSDNHKHYYTRENCSAKTFKDFFVSKKKDFSKRTFHLITFLGKDFRYESSLSDCITCTKQKQCSNSEVCNNSDLIKDFRSDKFFTTSELGIQKIKNEKFVIITGDPGSGKSVLLKHLSIEIKSLTMGQFWVIMIPLNNYQKDLDKYDSLKNSDNVVKFLCKIENCENDFSRNILSFFLNNNRLIIFFDGFDEIHEPSKQEKILGLLQFLKNENLTKQIWITSRPHCVRQIEEVLEVVAYEVQDINEDEQIKLVINEWKALHGDSLLNLIEKNADNLVKRFKNVISPKERDFLGVPLQTYMFSHAYKDEAVKTSPIYPQKISLVSVFEDFISSKFNIFFAEKAKIENFLQKDVISINEKRYQLVALRCSDIVSEEDVNILSATMNTTLSTEDVETLKRIGLIFETNNGCLFIHKTFAEYFISELLLFITENCKDKNVLKTVESILLNPENDFILHIFDSHIIKKSEGCKIFESIMHGKEEFVNSLNKKSLSISDVMGRNCFYYALRNNQFRILLRLIEKDVELKFETFFDDSFMHFSKSYFEIFNPQYEEVYFKLLEYIMEKENKDWYFDREILVFSP